MQVIINVKNSKVNYRSYLCHQPILVPIKYLHCLHQFNIFLKFIPARWMGSGGTIKPKDSVPLPLVLCGRQQCTLVCNDLMLLFLSKWALPWLWWQAWLCAEGLDDFLRIYSRKFFFVGEENYRQKPWYDSSPVVLSLKKKKLKTSLSLLWRVILRTIGWYL